MAYGPRYRWAMSAKQTERRRRLGYAVLARGTTLGGLAGRMGVPASTITRWCLGTNTEASEVTAETIAEHLSSMDLVALGEPLRVPPTCLEDGAMYPLTGG